MHLLLKRVIAALIGTFMIISCIPEMPNIEMSDCMKDCNELARVCMKESEDAMLNCTDTDKICQVQALHDAEACLMDCMDCIAVCVAVAEEKLKNAAE